MDWRASGASNGISRARSAASSSWTRSEEHTSELQSRENLVCRLLLEKKKKPHQKYPTICPTTTHTPALLVRLLHNPPQMHVTDDTHTTEPTYVSGHATPQHTALNHLN